MRFFKLFLEASALLLCWALVQATPAALQTQDDAAEAEERLFISISPEPCTGTTGRAGTCRSSFDCGLRGHSADGRCAWLGLGVCCVDPSTRATLTQCNGKTSAQEFTFRNPKYPSAETAALGACAATVTTGSNTCQLRLDFNELTLANPDNEGVCLDYLQVSGSNIPKICGKNTGQHLYVDVTPGSAVNIDVVTKSVGEKWDIKVTQIACNSADKAPSGCLQYYTNPTGTISSFNYNPSSSFGTRQLADQSYGACIKALSGYCSVTYTQAPGSSFSVSGDPTALSPALPRPPAVGSDCTADYLLIPGSAILDNSNFTDPKPTTADRFCGLSFPGAMTSLSPYKINFISNSDEVSGGDSNNEGFQLSYTLNACSG